MMAPFPVNLLFINPAQAVERRFRVNDANRDVALKSIEGEAMKRFIRYFDAFLRFRERYADERSIP